MTKETLRMQMLSGVITESEYKAKLEEAEAAQAVTAAEKIEDKVETSPSIEAAIDKLSDEEKAELTAALAKLGITADSSVESAAAKIAPKIEKVITEADEDLKKKVTKIASGLGIMLTAQNAIPLLSLVIGHAINPSSPLLTGVGLTFGVGGALIGLAKALDGKKVKESLNEHYVAGGIVGIGAINQIPSRAKADYEDAFEHFLGQKYSLNEMEKEVEEDLQQSDVKSAIDGKELDLKKLEDATKKAMSGDSTDLTLFLAGVFEGEEKSLYEAESPTKEEIAAFEAAVEQLMNMAGMSREDATMAIGRAANAKTK